MTCIVGFTKDNTVTMGADSAGVAGYNISTRRDAKIFNNEGFIIGCTSSFRMIQLLRYKFTPPKFRAGEVDIYEYMCTSFVDEVRKVFTDNGYMQKYTGGDDKGGHFLVGHAGRLFHVSEDFQVGENASGFDATGCGEGFALGALSILKDSDMEPCQIVRKALEVAEEHSAGVRGPFIIIDEKSKS